MIFDTAIGPFTSLQTFDDQPMTVAQQITQELQSLPEAIQREVLDFVEFLKARRLHVEDEGWSRFSLSHAMRGMEDEPDLYSNADIRNPCS
jgi:hypothetical protein